MSGARRGGWVGLVGLALACRDACERDCEDLARFVEACGPELEAIDFAATCHDGDAVQIYEDGSVDAGTARPCVDAADALDSCLTVTRARAEVLGPKQWRAELKECREADPVLGPGSRGDCAAAIEALTEAPPPR
jgi:hypothetical protein